MRTAQSTSLENPIIVPHELTPELYRKMLTVMFVEERMKIFVKQGKWLVPGLYTWSQESSDRHDHTAAAGV